MILNPGDNMKTIVTHSGTFHADEVSAIALLKVFKPKLYDIQRLPHQATLPRADYTLDIGRKYDGVHLFDHHQREQTDPMFELSSAGLIWKYIGKQEQYPQVTALVTMVDRNDVGLQKSTLGEYSRIIGAFNTPTIYDDNIQMLAFLDALHTAETVLSSMKAFQDELDGTEEYLIARFDSLSSWEEENGVLIADHYCKGWDKYLNGNITPNLRCITWPKEDEEGEWHAQVIPSKSGEYGLHGEGFKPSDDMIFVHSNEFFCVAKDRATMMEYLTGTP